MIRRLFSKNALRSISKISRNCNSDIIKDREKAHEKDFILREERRKMKKLRKTLKERTLQDDEHFYVSEDVDVEAVLEDRETVIRLLTENAVMHNEKLVKRLLQWKYEA